MAHMLSGLSIRTVQDLLFHLPLRYQDRTRITPIAALQVGTDCVIEGEVNATEIVFGRRRSLVCRLRDNSGTVTLRFFHFSATQVQNLQPGVRLRCYGETRRGSSGLELYHPEYQPIGDVEPTVTDQNLTPVYPSREGLTQKTWKNLSKQALTFLNPGTLTELLPYGVSGESSTVAIEAALRYLHSPPADAPVQLLRDGEHPFQRRLAFEELLAHNLSLLRLRKKTKSLRAPPLDDKRDLADKFLKNLPFQLTAAQQRVASEIKSDLSNSTPMLRLLQGDVGSGKTVVAALAALQAVACNYQVAIMAPTEILAEQHFNNFQQWFRPLGINLAWLTGKVKGKARRQQLEAILQHKAAVTIGTHALFQEEVQFSQLGLVIIDEQHRFGVHQRLALMEKAGADIDQPHQLVLTATPIPRTLAMSAYADLDTSVIGELPPGRTPISTVVIDNTRRDQVVARVRNACSEGRQAYWVCTLIEESETLSAQAAQDSCAALQIALPELRIQLIHGRMKNDEKNHIMQEFKNHNLDVLVATTVVEVGVDVSNASLMIIENAERLGLAQLHQLRGRVGRGTAASYCVLMYQSPLGQLGKQRLQIIRDSNDGFFIAEKDLEIRGPGEMLGTRQTGLINLRIANLQRDSHLLDQVKSTAEILINEEPVIAEQLVARWLDDSEHNAQV